MDTVTFLRFRDHKSCLNLISILDGRRFKRKILAIKPNGFLNYEFDDEFRAAEYKWQLEAVKVYNKENYEEDHLNEYFNLVHVGTRREVALGWSEKTPERKKISKYDAVGVISSQALIRHQVEIKSMEE